MCNERDRLIAYIYDECDATERDAVRQHLDGCDECRVEVGGLRSVREDLLAWDVPAHGSVWQPFAPAKPAAWWRQVPGWGMAAAASLVLLSGAAGGAIAHAFVAEPAQSPAVASRETPLTQASLTSADLAALEQRINARLSNQMGAVDARVQQVSSRTIPVSLTDGQASLSQEVVALRETNKKLRDLIDIYLANQDGIERKWEMKYGEVKGTLKNMQANMDAMASLVIK
jgi:hypothetical protein